MSELLTASKIQQRLDALRGAEVDGTSESVALGGGPHELASAPSASATISASAGMAPRGAQPRGATPDPDPVDRGVDSGQGGGSNRPPTSYRYVNTLGDAADDLIDTFRNTDGRFMLGIDALDHRMRGIGDGELAYLTGFAHSGKTQLVLQAIVNQQHQRVLWFSPDETATQVLAKLVSMIEGVDGAEVEQRVRNGDKRTLNAVYRVAHEALPYLLIVDEILDLEQMTEALREAESYWGGRAAMVGLDYIGLLAKGAEYGDLSSSSKAMKRWVKAIDRPGIVIHQGSRGGAGKGKELGLQSMAYAGEAEATFVLGVRRKFFDESLDAYERQKLEPTLTVQLLKNKRVSGGLGEVDLHLDTRTGAVREYTFDEPF